MQTFLKKDSFFHHYTVFFSGSMIVAVLNYLFHPLLGRMMDPADFGEVQVLISLIAQSGIILGAFSVIVVSVTSNIDDTLTRNAIIAEIQRTALLLICIVIVGLLISIDNIKHFLNFSSNKPFVALAFLLILSVATSFRSAYLQGRKRFFDLSINGILSSGSKLLLAVGLVSLGFGALGAILGIVCAQCISLIYLYIKTHKTLILNTKSSLHVLEKGSVKKEISYGVLVLFATGMATLFYTIDVVAIKHFFSAEEAGLYSGISAIGKIIFFVLGPSSAILLSSIKIKNTYRENAHILRNAMGISALLGTGGLLTFYLFHDIIINILIGTKYLSFAHFLPEVGLVMFLSAIANLLIFYFLALRRFFLIFVSIGITGLLFALLYATHTDIIAVLNAILYSIVTLITILSIVYAKDYFNYRSHT